MKVYVFFIFMVLHTITAEKALSKLRRKLFVPKIDDKCRKIKCPSVDEPECVRMKRNDLGINVHVIVVNKCELYYMQCHDNVEAKIVPMKFCSHNHGPVKKIMKDKSHSRVKRAVNEQENATDPVKTKHKKASETSKVLKKSSLSSILKPQSILSSKDSNKLKKSVSSIQSSKLAVSYDSPEIGNDQERKDLHDGNAGHPLVTGSWSNDKDVLDKIVFSLKYADQKRNTDNMELPDFAMLSNETDLADMEKEADLVEYKSDCPKVCPSRDVLVCARCQHGIFRTFISVCHMRMFTCNHIDEFLQLVSRTPCILSAPYLSEEGMEPKGRVVEDDDDDKIMRYIICRDQDRMDKDGKSADPRCSFPLIIKTNKFFYDYKHVRHPLDPHLVTNQTIHEVRSNSHSDDSDENKSQHTSHVIE